MQAAARQHGLPPAVRLRGLEGVGHSFEDNAERGALAEIAFGHFFGRRREGV
jgi:hypothetical protein